METLPERVVFDTNMPTVTLPPDFSQGTVPAPQSAFTFAQITPGPLPTFSPKARFAAKGHPITVKRGLAKIVATHRAPAQVHNYTVREGELETRPPVKTTLLQDIAGRFGQIFNVN